MGEMSTMASMYGLKMKIVNEQNYERTKKEIDDDVEIVFVEKNPKDSVTGVEDTGHAYVMDENGNFVDIATTPNDCYYGVICKLLEKRGVTKSISDVRQETANAIEANVNYDKVIEAQNWIHNRYSFEANTLLFGAGLKLNPDTNWIEVENDDLTSLNKSLKYTKRGGPAGKYFKVFFLDCFTYTIL